MKVTIGVTAGIGKGECEDCAFFHDRLAEESILQYVDAHMRCMGVADGVGGNAGGRDAGRFLASRIIGTDFSQMTQDEICDFSAGMNAELIRTASMMPGKTEMASTLSCIVAAADGFWLIHGGNTRVYVMQGSYLKQLTADHTTRNWLLERGQYEAAQHCSKSEINCCFGGGNAMYAQHVVIRKLFDDSLPETILMTSDGVHDYVDIDTMEDIMASSLSDQERVRLMTETAEQNGSCDDKTVIIARC